jgi:putative sugar O-methyltransferase
VKLFWKKHSSNRNFKLNTFRNTKKHNIFSSWSPYDRGLLFHNFLINYYVNQNKTEFIKFKKNINNLNLGKPPHILLDNKYHISYDDCVSFEEISFLKKNIRKKKLNIIEIGPGYGRSVEYILKNFDVGKYFLLDYGSILILTKKYLKKVLSKSLYKKIIFCDFEIFNFKKNFFLDKHGLKNFDLFFNSNSFHEIEKKIIKKYLNFFSSICNKFFIKNAMAKYKIQDLVNHLSRKDVPSFNKNLGLCSEVINIFDSKKVNFQSKAYLKKYNPYKSKAKVFSKLSEVYPSCVLALFVKDSD